MAVDVAEGLAFLASLDILHSDIKVCWCAAGRERNRRSRPKAAVTVAR